MMDPLLTSEVGRACTRELSCVLVIGGLDPSGGAGLAADLRALQLCGAWGCPVCAVLTVQSVAGVACTHPVAASLVAAQAEEVLAHQTVRAVKVGALGTLDNVRATTELLRRVRGRVPSVVDPVMIPTAGHADARLLDASAVQAMRDLMSVASLITPNAHEASVLAGKPVRSVRDAEAVAADLRTAGAGAVLIKGGHLSGDDACDVLVHQCGIEHLEAPRLNVAPFHGGGCTLASLIAGHLALATQPFNDEAVLASVRSAKHVLYESLKGAARVGDGLLVVPLVERTSSG